MTFASPRLISRVSTRRALPSAGLAIALGALGCNSRSERAAPSPAPAHSAPPVATSTSDPAYSSQHVVVENVPAPPDVAVPPPDAQKTASGLRSKVLKAGTGTEHPAPGDVETILYVGWRKDGKMFDRTGKKPVGLNLDMLTKGWAEGLSLMVAGETRRLWIPSALAYGDKPAVDSPLGPAGDIVMDVELVHLRKQTPSAAPAPSASIPAPADVAAPPKDAIKTKTGLAYRVLVPGKGAHPKPTDTVAVNYTGWTPDGKMFDSSVARSEPATLPLDHVIRGWTEGVPLLAVGSKARFWIPSELAYGEHPRPGAPAGPLTFDIELVGIK
jgi:FKBP-type peptidyl-prolyl cis-trans isomerase